MITSVYTLSIQAHIKLRHSQRGLRSHRNLFLHIENGRRLHWRAQGLNGALDKLPPPAILFIRRQGRIAERMVEFAAAHNPIGPHPRRYRIQARRQYGGQSGSFTLFGNRSAATRTGASRRRQDNRLHLTPQELGSYFGPDAAHGVEAAQIAYCDKQFTV